LLLERNLSHVFEFEIGMSSTADDGDVLRATHVSNPARDIDWIIVTAARNQDSYRRAPGIVGITIRSYVLPLSARLVNQGHSGARLSPNTSGSQLDVRNLGGQIAFLANSDCLCKRFKGLVSFIANVTDVNASELARNTGERNQFFGRCRLSG